jgi:hypothetical protein
MRLTAAIAMLAVCALAVQAAHAATLVAEYRFDVPGNLGLDTSGFGNHAVVSGVASGPDRFAVANMAGFFDGINDVMTKSGGLNGYDGLPGFTFAAWVNRASSDGGFSGIVSQDPAGAACCTNRLLLNPSDNPYFDAGAHADASFGSVVVPNDAWFHIVMTADDSIGGNQVKIFINGDLVGTHNFAHNLVNSSLFDTFIGTGENGNAHFFGGLLDDVQIYDGILSEGGAYRLYAFGTPAPEPASLALLALGASALVGRRRRA